MRTTPPHWFFDRYKGPEVKSRSQAGFAPDKKFRCRLTFRDVRITSVSNRPVLHTQHGIPGRLLRPKFFTFSPRPGGRHEHGVSATPIRASRTTGRSTTVNLLLLPPLAFCDSGLFTGAPRTRIKAQLQREGCGEATGSSSALPLGL